MKWSSIKNCPKSVATFDHLEILNEITGTEMTSRPVKKAKYTCQLIENNEKGLHVSAYSFRGNVSVGETSSDDSDGAIVLDPMSNVEDNPDHSERYFDPSSSCGDLPAISLNNSSGKDQTQMASTSSVARNLPEEIVENATAGQAGEASNCDCNANKNNAPKQINFALCRWQSKQLAQGIIDNAINKVLGDLGIPSNHSETLNPAFGEPRSWGSYLNAQNIENEGVVEAIRQQGLQHKRFVQQQPSSSQQSDSANNDIPHENPEETIRSGFNGPSGSSFPENALLTATDILSEIPTAPLKNSFSKKPDITSHLRAQNPVIQKSDLFDDVESLMKPEDLLNTAVSYAISEKGLGVLNVNE